MKRDDKATYVATPFGRRILQKSSFLDGLNPRQETWPQQNSTLLIVFSL